MKRLFLLTTMVSATLLAGAQVQFGVKAGLNLSTLNISPSEAGTSFKIAPNLNAGVLASVPLTSELSLQPEAVYSGQGAKVSSSSAETGHYNLGYINVPVLLKYQTSQGFFAELGPQIGFLVNAKAKSDGVSVDVKSSFKSSDFSGVLGIGYLSSLNLGVDVRYNLGFSNIVKTSSSSDNSSAKNGVIQVGVFYMFGKSKK